MENINKRKKSDFLQKIEDDTQVPILGSGTAMHIKPLCF